ASRCTGMAPRTRTRFSLLWARAPRQARGWKKRSSRFPHCSAAKTRYLSETARLERIVSKRKDSAYRSGRSPDWLKMKNADAPAVKRGVQGKRAAGRVAGVERDVVKRESDYARPRGCRPRRATTARLAI